MLVVGLIGSITHYHNESLECLVHADEAHFVQDEDALCLVCAIVHNRAPEKASPSTLLRLSDETILIFNEPYLEKSLAPSNISRAPPVLS